MRKWEQWAKRVSESAGVFNDQSTPHNVENENPKRPKNGWVYTRGKIYKWGI